MTNPRPIRVLVVDDSATVRMVLARRFSEQPDMEVVGQARDGIQALEQARELQPDVITLDVEMPRMDGLAALERLMAETPTRVVMISSLTRAGTDATIRALELGAVDFIEKPTAGGIQVPQRLGEELTEKVRAAARTRLRRARPPAPAERPAGAVPVAPARNAFHRKIIVIGSSTGGPQALREVTTRLPADLGVPVVIVQHMPAGFTLSLAQRLNQLGPLPVDEAREGSRLEDGRIMLAPGGYHLVFDRQGVAHLNSDPEEGGVRPAVNITMQSLVEDLRAPIVAAVLTGMGQDGTRGARLIKDARGEVLVQDEATCVVYGMPRAVVEAGLADEVVPLEQIAEAIDRRVRRIAAVRAQ